MDRILIILKKENGPRASSTPELGLNTILSNMFIGICSRSQVSVYRTIGPLVPSFSSLFMNTQIRLLYPRHLCRRVYSFRFFVCLFVSSFLR